MKKVVLFLCLVTLSSCWAKTTAENSSQPEITNENSKKINELLDVEKKIIHVYHQAVPAVVNVSNIKIADSFYYGRVEVPQGAGTGFVWDKEGHIVTNFHVVQGGNSFVVSFHNDKKQYRAKVVGTAPTKDIAVLKLEEIPSDLVTIAPGASKDLMVGQIALAIGNPFGLDHSLSKGIISALGRKIDGIGGVKIHNMIQTDAAINQGNSGGPLLDSRGELIGMNTMIFSTSGSSSGLGFAVPVDTIKQIVPQLISHGKVIRPGLGISPMPDHIRQRYFGEKGIAVEYADPESSAGRAGIQGFMRDRYGRLYPGDLILTINKVEVNSRDDIFHLLEKYNIGDTVDVEYLREGKKKIAKITLQEI